MRVPMLLGVNVTEQLAVVTLIPARVHGLPVKSPEAVPVFVNATVPAGVEFVPDEVFLTNALQFVD